MLWIEFVFILHDVNIDEQDLDRQFRLPHTTYIGGDKAELPLREIIKRLEVWQLNLYSTHPYFVTSVIV